MERVLTSMQGCSLDARYFGDTGGVERARVVETWLGVESDAEAILDIADAELWAASSAGEMDAGAEDGPEGNEEDERVKDKTFMCIGALRPTCKRMLAHP